MKKSLNFNFNLPEYEDAIDIEKLTDNFSSIDTALMATRVKKTRKTNSIEVSAVQPYVVIKNNNEVTITYTDIFDKEWTLEAGKSRKFAIESNSLNNFKVQVKDGLEADFEWFIDVDTAIKEGGGGGGGTSNYNDLENLPKINGVELTGNKSLDNIGAIAADSKGAANGVASLGEDGKVPPSQLPNIEQKEYKLAETTSEGYAKGYKLQYKSGSTWVDVSDSAAINIPKDMVVESGSVKECSADNVPVSGYKKGDKYIDLVIANKTDAHIYINVKDLVDNKASGISYSNTDSELDATTVQSAIDEIAEIIAGKEDTANKITAWQSTSDNTHYPSEKLVKDSLDKKVQKTTVVRDPASGETEISTRTVPANCTAAMVAKISGKTIRANIFSGYTSMGSYTNASEKYNGHDCITSTGAWGGAYDINMVLKSGKTYVISAMIKTSVANTVYSIGEGEAGTLLGSMTIPSANTWTKMTVKVNATRDITKVRIGSQTAVTSTISEFMVSEYDQLIPYCPPSSLASAPVESVVSQGKNIADTIYGKTLNATYGTPGDGIGVISDFVEVDYTKTYYVTGISTNTSNNCFYAWYDANKNFIARNTSAARTYIGITGLPSNAKYIRINQYLQSTSEYASVKFMMSENASTPYTPYNKTTVLVPSAVKNLPDYGLGIVKSDGTIVANEVDFENGVYYHRVGQVDFKDLTFKPASEATFTYYYQFAEAKANSECICSKYTTSLDFTNDKIININQYHSLLLRDTSISSASAVSTTNSGVKIVYERDSVEVKPLTDYIRPLPVENGGTLTLVNEHNLDINSTIKYKKEVN